MADGGKGFVASRLREASKTKTPRADKPWRFVIPGASGAGGRFQYRPLPRGTRPPKAGRPWRPQEVALLGKMPDDEVARRTRRTLCAVMSPKH